VRIRHQAGLAVGATLDISVNRVAESDLNMLHLEGRPVLKDEVIMWHICQFDGRIGSAQWYR
jgi:hypothetical protein